MVKTVVRKREDSSEEVETYIPVLLPHLILEYLFNEAGLEIRPSVLQKYWQHCKAVMPWASSSDFDGSRIPISLYGDTARYGQGYDQSKVCGFWMSLVLWRPRSTRMSNWLLWCLNADLSLGARSHNPLLLACVQSLNAAFNGETPAGVPMAHKFAVTEIRGDWEFQYQSFQMTRFWKSRFICWRCDAENHANAENRYLDLKESPSWENTELTHIQFLNMVVGDRWISLLIAISYFDIPT